MTGLFSRSKSPLYFTMISHRLFVSSKPVSKPSDFRLSSSVISNARFRMFSIFCESIFSPDFILRQTGDAAGLSLFISYIICMGCQKSIPLPLPYNPHLLSLLSHRQNAWQAAPSRYPPHPPAPMPQKDFQA